MKKTVKKVFLSFLGCFLALVFALQPALNTFAVIAANENWKDVPISTLLANSEQDLSTYYISEIKIGSYSSLIAEGFTVDKESATNRYYDDEGELCYLGELSGVNGYGYCIGYKLTQDKDDAIYDISVMDMYGEYSEMTYREVLADQQKNMLALAERVQAAADKLAENYEDGSTYAKLAVEILNNLTITVDRGEDDSKQKLTYSLGDFMLGKCGTQELQDYLDMVFLCSTSTTGLIYNMLSIAVFDDLSVDGATSWLDRLCETEPFAPTDANGNVITDAGDLNAYYADNGLDAEYIEGAEEIYRTVKTFIDKYVEAKSRYNENEQITTEDVKIAQEVNEGQIADREGNQETFTEAEQSTADSVNDVMYLTLFEALNAKSEVVHEPDLEALNEYLDGYDSLEQYLEEYAQFVEDGGATQEEYEAEKEYLERLQNGYTEVEARYPYGTNEDGTQRTLAEFLLEACTIDEDSIIYKNDLYRPFYTFLMENENGNVPLNTEQATMFYLCGLNNAILLGVDTLNIDEMRTEANDTINSLKKDINQTAVSIYYDVDSTLLKSFNEGTGIYWTNTAGRLMAAQNRYDLLTKAAVEEGETALDRVQKAIDWLSMLSGVIGGVGGIISSIMGGFVLASGVTCSTVAAAVFAGQAAIYTTATVVFSVAATAMSVIATVATVVVLLLSVILLLIKALKKPNYDLEYTDIPECIYDYGDSVVLEGAALKYYPVKACGVDSPDDTNVFSYFRQVWCMPWVCLYYTKDSAAAEEPITVDFVNGEKQTIPFVSYVEGTIYCDSDVDVNEKAGILDYDYYTFKELTGNQLVWHYYNQEWDEYEVDVQYYAGSAIEGIEGCEKYSTVDGGDGYTPIHAFDDVAPYNFAAYSYDDKWPDTMDSRLKKIGNLTKTMKWYMHRPSTFNTDTSTNIYLKDIILSSSEDEEIAKTKIIAKGYTLIDSNLTPTSKYYTYIGYTTTSLKTNACVDIRWAYCPGVDMDDPSTLGYGGTTYVCGGHVGNLALFYTSTNSSGTSTAGTPILINGPTSEEYPNGKEGAGLIITDEMHSGDGYEPVNLFCGGPAFDVDNCGDWLVSFDDDQNIYSTASEDVTTWDSHVYLYFYPETTYTDGPDYLGGLTFFSGRDDGYSDQQVLIYMEEMGWSLMSDIDVSGHTYVMDLNKTYLAYYVTHNPYRAIYDVKQYTAESNADSMVYSISAGSAGSYCVCEVFQQGGEGFVKYWERSMRPSHAYRTGEYTDGALADGEVLIYTISDGQVDLIHNTYGIIVNGYFREAVTLADGYSIGFRQVTKAGLYVLGNTTSDISQANPLLVTDLYASTSADYNSSTTTPVRSFTDWYSEEPADLDYTEAYSTDVYYLFRDTYIDCEDIMGENGIDLPDGYDMDDARDYNWHNIDDATYDNAKINLYKDEHCYLFIRRADTSRPYHVSSVKVAYAGNNSYTGSDANTELQDLINRSPIDETILELVSNGPGQLIRINLTESNCDDDTDYNASYIPWVPIPVSKIYVDNNEDNYPYWKAIGKLNDDTGYLQSSDLEYNIPVLSDWRSDEVAYIWVTYTNSTVYNVLSDVRILETDASDFDEDDIKNEIIVNNGAKAQKSGDSFLWNGKYYTLYSIYGLSNAITEFTVDKNVFVRDEWTACSTDGTASSYTGYFFHMKQARKYLGKYYIAISSIVTAYAGTEYDAQIELLNKGCRCCYPVNLKSGEGGALYLGYLTTSTSSDALSNIVLQNNGQDDTVLQLRIGSEEYVRMTSALNYGVYDAIVDLYGTTNATRAMSSGSKAGRYLTGLIFWSDPDFWQLFNGTDEEVEANVELYLSTLSDEDREYLEYYLYSTQYGGKKLLYYSAVTDIYGNVMNCNLSSTNFASDSATGNEVYIFACYSDNTITTPKSLVGSIFESTASVGIICTTVGLMAVAAGAAIVIKKKRKMANETV